MALPALEEAGPWGGQTQAEAALGLPPRPLQRPRDWPGSPRPSFTHTLGADCVPREQNQPRPLSSWNFPEKNGSELFSPSLARRVPTPARPRELCDLGRITCHVSSGQSQPSRSPELSTRAGACVEKGQVDAARCDLGVWKGPRCPPRGDGSPLRGVSSNPHHDGMRGNPGLGSSHPPATPLAVTLTGGSHHLHNRGPWLCPRGPARLSWAQEGLFVPRPPLQLMPGQALGVGKERGPGQPRRSRGLGCGHPKRNSSKPGPGQPRTQKPP